MEQKQFLSAIEQICEEKNIPKEKVIETIEMALAAAYKKDYGKKGQIIRAKFNPETGNVKMRQVKLVVDKSMLKEEPAQGDTADDGEEKAKEEMVEPKKALVAAVATASVETEEAAKEEGLLLEEKVRFNPERHIMLEEAQKKYKKIKPGEEYNIPLKSHEDFGRIAAQTAKQVIIQRIREAERDVIYDNFKGKEGQVLSGIIQRLEMGNVFIDLGKTTGILFEDQRIPGEDYRPGQRKRVYIMEVAREARGPLIILSRNHPKLVTRLFEFEVPEIASGIVVIKSIAREPGSRTKVAVASSKSEIDPIGACVGQRGTRVQAVINELGGEKIDIILYDDEPKKYLAQALSPGKVVEVKIINEKRKEAQAIVAEDQMSLTIGKAGQNVRLAARLTGWKIDVVKEEEGKKTAKIEKVAGPAAASVKEPAKKEKQAKGKKVIIRKGKEATAKRTKKIKKGGKEAKEKTKEPKEEKL